MKKFNIYDYPNGCPIAKAVENAVNNCTTVEKHHHAIGQIMGYQERQTSFFIACILYWSQTDRYDERNKWAVLISRKIAESFPQLKKRPLDEDIQHEAFAFTTFAHRYLQGSLFKVILHDFNLTGEYGLHQWYMDKQFVIDDIADEAVPYEEYKKRH